MDNGNVTLEVRSVMGEAPDSSATNSVHLQVEPSPTEPGLYQATFVPRATGGYQASTVVTNLTGTEVGRAAAGWSTDLAAEEFRSLSPNLSLLESIAHKTGGEVISINGLDRFARELPHRTAPVMDSWTFPLWHTPAVFAAALLFLISEWGLRRWNGLP
jgi:hypothetical protein